MEEIKTEQIVEQKKINILEEPIFIGLASELEENLEEVDLEVLLAEQAKAEQDKGEKDAVSKTD